MKAFKVSDTFLRNESVEMLADRVSGWILALSNPNNMEMRGRAFGSLFVCIFY